MNTRFCICISLLAAFAAVTLAPLGLAGTRAEGHYTVAGIPFGSGELCAPSCAGVEGLNLGRHDFAPNGMTPARIEVTDTYGRLAPFTACQDVTGDRGCIIGEDPWASGCGSADLVGFSPDHPVQVVVKTKFMWSCEESLATTGTLTLYYAE